MSIKEKLSTLWIVVMVNVAMADIFSFMIERMAGSQAPQTQVPIAGMLIFAIIMEIPIAMIFLSRVLKGSVNKWANIAAAVITIAFVILGGSLNLVYIFFAAVETLCLVYLIALAWKQLPEMA